MDLSDDAAFEAWQKNMREEDFLPETHDSPHGEIVERTSRNPIHPDPPPAEKPYSVDSCGYEVRNEDGSVNYTALYKNCVCVCMNTGEQNPDAIEECIRQCKLPGVFTDGEYHSSDGSSEKIDEAGDFKSFYDFSFRGNGGAFGVAYELTDGYARVPWGPKKRFRDPDDETGQCPKNWKREASGKCSRGYRVNLTTAAGLSEQAIGFHLGLKFIPIFEGGVFVGGKYNFEEDEPEMTLGLEWIKLRF